VLRREFLVQQLENSCCPKAYQFYLESMPQYSALCRKRMDLDPTCPMCGVDYMKKLLNLHIPF